MPTKSTIFDCEILTPMFIGNAIPGEAELRPSAIKGALRFWWRAMHGGLPNLLEEESKIFGSADEKKGGRSKVIIEILKKLENIKTGLPTNHNFKTTMYQDTRRGNRDDVDIIKFLAYGSESKNYFDVNQTTKPSNFSFKISYNDIAFESILKDIVNMISVFGGLGSKSRNGFGRFFASTNNEPLEDIQIVLKKYMTASKSDFTALSKSIELYALNGGPYSIWHDLLAGLGTAYKTGKESAGDNPHNYEKRVIIGAPIGTYNKHRHSKTHFFGITKSVNVFNGFILFLPYDYLIGADDYINNPANFSTWKSDYASVTAKFNADLINMKKVII